MINPEDAQIMDALEMALALLRKRVGEDEFGEEGKPEEMPQEYMEEPKEPKLVVMIGKKK